MKDRLLDRFNETGRRGLKVLMDFLYHWYGHNNTTLLCTFDVSYQELYVIYKLIRIYNYNIQTIVHETKSICVV